MAVTALEIKTRSPFAQGTTFGDVGPYEQLDGTVQFAVDPDHPRNAGVEGLQVGAELERRIRDRSGRPGVIGLGYVGLPLAVEMARAGFQVTGIDIDAGRVEGQDAGL